jgi:SOS-response transcriptional repressor LexA
MDQKTKLLYDFIIKYKRENDGNSPGREEMATAMGLRSKSGVGEHLDKLEAMKLITRPKGVARTVSVVAGNWSVKEDREPDVVLKVYLVEHGYEAHIIIDGQPYHERVRDFKEDVSIDTMRQNIVFRLDDLLEGFRNNPKNIGI